VFTRARQAAILVTVVGIFGSNRRLAAQPDCSSLAVDAGAGVGARWPDLGERIRDALDGRADIDHCARVTISLAQAGIVVVVVLPDGRQASRVVPLADDVVPTLEALLLLPASAPGAPDVEPARAPKRAGGGSVAAMPRAAPVVSVSLPAASGTISEPARVRLEFSVGAGARAGDGQVGFNLAALTLFDVAGWLLGFEAAASGYRDHEGGPGASALAAALVGGRRVRFDSVALDVMAGPALAVRGIGTSVAVARMADGSGAAPPPVDDGPWARLLWGARMTFRARSLVRTFAGLDGEIALGLPSANLPDGEPRLPKWTVGAVLGVTVGTR
jgi:hypothetical protein